MTFNNWYQFEKDSINSVYASPSHARYWLSLTLHDNNTEDSAREFINYYNSSQTTWQMFDNNSYDNQSTWFSIHETKYAGLNITLERELIGNATIIWEYYSQYGSTSCPTTPVFLPLNLTVNTCGNLTSIGECSLEWTMPDDMGHCYQTGTIGYGGYWRGYHVRARIVNVTGVTQSPAITINETKARMYEILIPAGDTVNPKDLYDASLANGWGIVSSPNNYSYYVEANVFVVGTLEIKNGLVLQIGDMENYYYGANYDLKTFVGSVFQMGELNDAGIGIYGGTFIYANHPPRTPYYYEYGTWYIYDSTFFRQGGGYGQFGFASGSTLNFTDSNIESLNTDTLFFVGNEGIIKRTIINADTFYNYAPLLNFESVLFGAGNIYSSPTTNWQLFNTVSTNMDGYDMNSFANDKVTTYSSNDAYFTDSNYLEEKVRCLSLGTCSVTAKDYRTLKVTAIDSNTGLALENVTVTVLDNRNYSVIFDQELRTIKKDDEYNHIYYTRIGTIHDPKYIQCKNRTVVIDCDTYLAVGDTFMRNNGYYTIMNMTAHTAYVDFNELMSFGNVTVCAGGNSYPQWLHQNLSTTSEGYLPTYGEGHEYVILNRIAWADTDKVEYHYDLNPHIFRFEKEGYSTIEFELNITTAVGASWENPLSLFVRMEAGSGSASAGNIFFIYDEDKRVFNLP